MVWYSHLFQNFLVIHTVKGFGIVNKAEKDVFLEFPCFLNDPVDVGSLIFGSSEEVKLLSRVQLFATPWTVARSGSSVHGVLQATILEWVAISFSRGSSQLRD